MNETYRSAPLSYRPVTAADTPFLTKLYASTRRDELATTGWPPEMQQQFLQQQFALQDRHYRHHFNDAEFTVIVCDGEDVGRLYYRWQGADLHLIDIALMPECRYQGIGSLIVRELMARVSQTGGQLELKVERSNPARNWYHRLGFQLVADLGVYLQLCWSASPKIR